MIKIENCDARIVDSSSLAGRGNQGTVYSLLSWNGHEKVAVKHFKSSDRNDFAREFAALSKLSHDNIVKLLAYNPSTEELILEWADYGSLFEMLHSQKNEKDHGPLPFSEYSIAMDICRGLRYLHSQAEPIFHLDIKSANVLLAKGGAKIADFGMATIKSAPDARVSRVFGTVAYIAPECVIEEEGILAAPVDIYSCGVVFWEIVTRKIPFRDLAPSFIPLKLQMGHRPESHSPTAAEKLSPKWRLLIEKCWAQDPLDRPNANDLYSMLEAFDQPNFQQVFLARPRSIHLPHQQRERTASQMLAQREFRSSMSFGSMLGRARNSTAILSSEEQQFINQFRSSRRLRSDTTKKSFVNAAPSSTQQRDVKPSAAPLSGSPTTPTAVSITIEEEEKSAPFDAAQYLTEQKAILDTALASVGWDDLSLPPHEADVTPECLLKKPPAYGPSKSSDSTVWILPANFDWLRPPLRECKTLEEAVQAVQDSEMILLAPMTYSLTFRVSSTLQLKSGVTIAGMHSNRTVIEVQRDRHLFELREGNAVLANMTIAFKSHGLPLLPLVVSAHAGSEVSLTRCHIRGKGSYGILSFGIVRLSYCTIESCSQRCIASNHLLADSCIFRDCSPVAVTTTAHFTQCSFSEARSVSIVVAEDATLSLSRCSFKNVPQGIRLMTGASMLAERCRFAKFKTAIITEEVAGHGRSGVGEIRLKESRFKHGGNSGVSSLTGQFGVLVVGCFFKGVPTAIEARDSRYVYVSRTMIEAFLKESSCGVYIGDRVAKFSLHSSYIRDVKNALRLSDSLNNLDISRCSFEYCRCVILHDRSPAAAKFAAALSSNGNNSLLSIDEPVVDHGTIAQRFDVFA